MIVSTNALSYKLFGEFLTREPASTLPQIIMRAVFSQPLPRDQSFGPFKGMDDLLHALRHGWAYDPQQGQQLLDQFGTWDLHYHESWADAWGMGVVVWTPDGTALESGEDLVAWRDKRWAAMRAEGLQQAMQAPKPSVKHCRL